MPALEAFGRKWKIGSDDFVFPYAGSIAMRIVWFVLVGGVMLTYNKNYSCNDERLLKVYLFVLTGIHICMAIVEVVIVVISARGTIANPEPRKNIHIPLYIQFVFFVLEFGWDITGVVWAFDPSIDCHKSHSVLLLTRGVLIWNLLVSVIIGFYLILRIGVCRLPCCYIPPNKMRYERLAPEETYGGRRLSKLSSSHLVHHKRQRLWQWRVQWIFWWMRLSGQQQTAFADVSATLSDAFTYFRGYVPSDILTGIALLTMEQHQALVEEDDDGSITRKCLDFQNKLVCKHYNRSVRYMKFAAAAYGYPAFLHRKGVVLGLCRLTDKCKCCRCCNQGKGGMKVLENETNEECVVRGDSCGWNIKTLKLCAGINEDDVVYASFSSEVFCPAFFVAFDHKEEAIVISIRGTMSLHDLLTDLSAEPMILTTCEEGDIYGHKGMMGCAHALQLKLESEQLLEKAFLLHPSYRLVIVGHSLGAAVASLLAIILKPHYPKLHCFAYSPPGCVINMDAVPYTRSFITSVVLGNDIIPRLRAESFEAFSLKVLDCIQMNHLPKYRIILDSFLYWTGCCRYLLQKKKRILSATELAIKKDPHLNTEFDANADEEDIYDVVADTKLLRQIDKVTGKQKIIPRPKMALFIPGRIIHISWGKPFTMCCGLYKQQRVLAHWTAQSEFSELVLQKKIVNHHMPYTVLKYMIKLQKQERTCTLD